MTMTRTILELRDVTRCYGDATAVAAARFSLHEGRIACLLGPSGCGKSTLLRMIAGLEPVDAGDILIAGQIVSTAGRMVAPEARGVGLVFQDNALFPHLDVRGNVGFGLKHLPGAVRTARVAHLLDQFHVGHLAKSWPHMLSGGEQQRVAIARALAREPSLLLLDEPFSGLDGYLRETVRTALLDDLRRAGATVLVVTHDPEEAMTIADDLILMAGGRILQVGSPEHCYRHPVSPSAARLLGDMVLLPGHISAQRIETALGTFPAPGHADGPAQLGLRPESLHIAANANANANANAIVSDVRFLGNGFRVRLDIGGTPVTLRINDAAPQQGQRIGINFDATAARIFTNNG